MAKRKHNKKLLPARVGEAPTPERRRQGSGIVAEVIDRDGGGKVLMHRFKAAADCPLDSYILRGNLTQAEYRAGIKFRHAYLRGVLRVHVEDIGSGAHGDPEQAALTPIYSERALREAYEVLSARQKAIVIAVCGHDEWAGGTVNIKTLQRGLGMMADLWKLN
jgi:hypothetical protein